MLKNPLTRPIVLFLFTCLVLFGIVACSAGNTGGASSTPTTSHATPVPTTQPATPSPPSVPQSPFTIAKIDLSVNPTTITGVACGTPVTVTYTATFHAVSNSPGGTVKFSYTVNNGRGETPASIDFGQGETTKAYTFTWSGALPLDHTYPEPGGIQVTSPNQLTSSLVGPVGQCRVAQAASWQMISSPNVGTSFNQLYGVAAVSASNIWTVGNDSAGTLIEHWNGTSWQVVSSPNVGTYNYLYGVAAVSSTNIWAVGYSQNSSGRYTLIEHWNGTSWQVVASPNAATSSSQLNGVAALSATNLWAVGYSEYSNGAYRQTLIEHWNGTNWKIISSPNPGTVYNELGAVTALSATNLWAVGYSTNNNGIAQTLIEQWNGTSWQVVPSPNSGTYPNELNGVAAVSPTDIWTVGIYRTGRGTTQTLIEQWNGTSWQVVSSPNPETSNNSLSSVAAVSATNLWVVGDDTNSSGDYQTLIEHWNGKTWQVVTSPNPGTGNNSLNGVVAVSSSNLWAVGSYINGRFLTLTEEYS